MTNREPRTPLRTLLATVTLATACADADTGADASDETTGGSGIDIDPGSSSEEGDDGNGPGGHAEEATCDLSFFTCPHVLRNQVMLVLDNSYSMRSPRVGMWDDDADDADDDGFVDSDPAQPATPRVLRWSALHREVSGLHNGYDESFLDLGAVLFPAFDPEAAEAPQCTIAGAPEIPFAADWQALALERQIPWSIDTADGGASPAAAGLEAAIAALDARPDAELPGAIVLVTDGPANCGDDPDVFDPRLAEVAAIARARGIPTHIIGLDIPAGVVEPEIDDLPDVVGPTDVRATLVEVAAAAGGEYHDAPTREALADALAAAADAAIACTVEFPIAVDPAIYDLDQLRVTDMDANSKTFDHEVADCSGESGWRFVDGDRRRLELCGDACALFKNRGTIDLGVLCADPDT